LKRTPLNRNKSAASVRRSGQPGKLGIVRLYGSDLDKLRSDCFDRDKGRCQWPVGNGICGKHLIYESGYWDSMHMAHIIGRGRGGSDVIGNVRSLCMEDHLVSEHNPKPCPKKVA
jgi:5-methylcytosine-specific restriction endonuclease McrA